MGRGGRGQAPPPQRPQKGGGEGTVGERAWPQRRGRGHHCPPSWGRVPRGCVLLAGGASTGCGRGLRGGGVASGVAPASPRPGAPAELVRADAPPWGRGRGPGVGRGLQGRGPGEGGVPSLWPHPPPISAWPLPPSPNPPERRGGGGGRRRKLRAGGAGAWRGVSRRAGPRRGAGGSAGSAGGAWGSRGAGRGGRGPPAPQPPPAAPGAPPPPPPPPPPR